MSVTDLRDALADASISLNAYADALLAAPEFEVSAERTAATVVERTVESLGLFDGAVYADIMKAAALEDLHPCTLELAVHLRLQWRDQPEGPYLTVASTKLRPDEGFPNGLYLRRLEDGLWLRGYRASDDWVFPPEAQWVFRRFS